MNPCRHHSGVESREAKLRTRPLGDNHPPPEKDTQNKTKNKEGVWGKNGGGFSQNFRFLVSGELLQRAYTLRTGSI